LSHTPDRNLSHAPDELRTARPVHPRDGGGSGRARHVLGPLISWKRLESPVVGRLYALGIVVAAAGVLTVAATIHPQQRLMGTHQQIGLPPCGFLVLTGLPCPTCGMTTAFAHTVRGEFAAAVRSQLAGFALAAATVIAGGIGLLALVTGRRPSLNWYRINPVHTIWWCAAAFVFAWAIKMILGLMNGTLPYRGG
jgi:hypothetical protein